jgi:hypothetical protein
LVIGDEEAPPAAEVAASIPASDEDLVECCVRGAGPAAGAARASTRRSVSGQKKSQKEGRLNIDMTSGPVLPMGVGICVFFLIVKKRYKVQNRPGLISLVCQF